VLDVSSVLKITDGGKFWWRFGFRRIGVEGNRGADLSLKSDLDILSTTFKQSGLSKAVI
jgi:hypothetical protein